MQTLARIGRRLRSPALEAAGVLLLLLAARRGGLGAAWAWWVLPALAVLAVAVSATVHTWWDGARRGLALHLRTLSQISVLALAAYASGAGPGLAVPLLLLGLIDTVRHAGSGAVRTALGWGLGALVAGQVLVTAGLAPSLLPTASSHAVAGVGALLLVFVGTRIARLTASSEHAQEEAVREAGRTRAVRRELEEALEHRAFHDELTGMANRALLLDRLRHTAARARRHGDVYAVLYVDLDGFKPINDTYGHVTGDEVLTGVGRRLARAVRDADTVARVGGDEFAVLLESPDGVEEAVRVAERLLSSLREPLPTSTGELRVTASTGIAMGGDADDADDVLRNADIAMYRAKRAGTGRYAIFERAMHTAVARRLKLETELQRAIERAEIIVHYQPIVRLDDGRVIALEALARWQHPERGLVSPGEFIPVAEQTGQIVAIGTAVLEQACDQLARWRRVLPGADDLIVTVNVSMHQLLDVDLPADVARVLRATDLPGRCLTLEITETALAHDADRARGVLLRLKELGVRIALDDFGTGYSSLSYLNRFPVDVLKIDRSFVTAHAEDGRSGRGELARAMVELGRSLDLITVAEGIEEIAELEHFRGLGCPLGQGFLFARPADAIAAGARLHDLLDDPGPDLRPGVPAGR